MYEKLKYWITLLYHNAKKELIEKPLASSGVLVGIFVVVLPLLISKSLRGFVVYLLSKIFLPQIEASLFPLTIALVALLAVAFIPSKKENRKKNYYFIEYGDFKWKITVSSMGPYVNRSPFCKTHQVKMFSTSNDLYVCPVCGSKDAMKLPSSRRNLLHEAVENLAEAEHDEHINV